MVELGYSQPLALLLGRRARQWEGPRGKEKQAARMGKKHGELTVDTIQARCLYQTAGCSREVVSEIRIRRYNGEYFSGANTAY